MFYRLQRKCLRSRFFSFVSLQKSCIWPQESPKGFNYTPCNVENIWTSWPWTTFSSRRKKLLGSTRLQSIPWLGGLYKIGLDHICAWESELLVIVVCSYRGAHTAACRNPHSTGSFSQEYVRNPKVKRITRWFPYWLGFTTDLPSAHSH